METFEKILTEYGLRMITSGERVKEDASNETYDIKPYIEKRMKSTQNARYLMKMLLEFEVDITVKELELFLKKMKIKGKRSELAELGLNKLTVTQEGDALGMCESSSTAYECFKIKTKIEQNKELYIWKNPELKMKYSFDAEQTLTEYVKKIVSELEKLYKEIEESEEAKILYKRLVESIQMEADEIIEYKREKTALETYFFDVGLRLVDDFERIDIKLEKWLSNKRFENKNKTRILEDVINHRWYLKVVNVERFLDYLRLEHLGEQDKKFLRKHTIELDEHTKKIVIRPIAVQTIQNMVEENLEYYKERYKGIAIKNLFTKSELANEFVEKVKEERNCFVEEFNKLQCLEKIKQEMESHLEKTMEKIKHN